MALDPKIQIAANELVWARIQGDLARCPPACPEPLRALFAVRAVAHSRGVEADQAEKLLVREVVVRAADLDPYSQETRVAEVQRAIRGDSRLVDNPGER